MRLLASLALLVAACAPTMTAPPEGGTVRVFGGDRVEGRYVSPNAYQHYIQAQLSSLAGNGPEAVDELRRALASDGASAYLRVRLAEELLALGRTDEARDEIDGALRIDPRFAEAYVDLGRVDLTVGDVAAAERSFRRAFDLDRTCEDAYLALAALYQDRGDAQRADQLYRLLGDRVPRSAIAHYHLARAASRRGDLTTTEAELRKALEIEPGLVDACHFLGELLLADGRADKAATELAGCFEHSGGDLGIASLLYDAHVAAGQTQAAQRLVDGLSDLSAPLEHALAVARLLTEHHLGARAIALVDGVTRGRVPAAATSAVALVRGAALDDLHRNADAIAELGKVAAKSPEFARARTRMARILVGEDRLPEAIELLKAALIQADTSPERDDLVAALADVDERAGDHSAALRLLRASLQVRPRSDVLSYALVRHLERAGEWDDAIAEARAVLRRKPDDIAAMDFLGRTLTTHDVRLDEARKLLEAVVTAEPTAGEFADDLGWTYLKLGKIADAERQLARAGRLRHDAPEVSAHLGALYLKQGERARALDAYRRALAQKPEEPLRHAVEEQLLLLERGRVGSR